MSYYLIAVLTSFVLLTGFLLLVGVEQRREVRLFGTARRRLDIRVARLTFIFTHIDWAGFFAHITKVTLTRVAHDLVHGTLLAVRTVERTLTRTIRTLRERVALHTPSEEPTEGSQLRATISRFRKTMRRERGVPLPETKTTL